MQVDTNRKPDVCNTYKGTEPAYPVESDFVAGWLHLLSNMTLIFVWTKTDKVTLAKLMYQLQRDSRILYKIKHFPQIKILNLSSP